jgi:hypothetical protein
MRSSNGGDASQEAARASELELHRIPHTGSLRRGIQGVGEAGRERPELAPYLQVAGRVVDGDLEALLVPRPATLALSRRSPNR